LSPLAERLRDALVALTPEHPDAVVALRPLYSPTMVFRDPIQEIHGLAAFLEMNRRLLGRMRQLSWDVVATQGDAHEAFLEWTMRGTTRLGPAIEVTGVTRVRAHDGLVVDHRDYWDLGELMASALPSGQRLLTLLRAPFA
jgi:limonene-1,2-epoxide hydrolase